MTLYPASFAQSRQFKVGRFWHMFLYFILKKTLLFGTLV